VLFHLAALGFAGLHLQSPAKPAAAEKAACLHLPLAAAVRFSTSSVAYGDSSR